MDFSYDLGRDEARRRSAVMDALGGCWDPVEVLTGQRHAWDLLYSGLDVEQQRLYGELVEAGVLPERSADRVAD